MKFPVIWPIIYWSKKYHVSICQKVLANADILFRFYIASQLLGIWVVVNWFEILKKKVVKPKVADIVNIFLTTTIQHFVWWPLWRMPNTIEELCVLCVSMDIGNVVTFIRDPDEGHKLKPVGLTIKFFCKLQVLLEFWPVSLLHAPWRWVKLHQNLLLWFHCWVPIAVLHVYE